MRNAARLNQLLLFLRIAAPEEKRLGRRLLGKRSDNPVCQNFPPFFRVASGRAFFDSQNRVQKQDALRRPAGKIAVSRDIAVVTKAEITVGALEACIRKAGGKLLREVALFDIYQGKGVAEGKKSVAFNLVLRADDRSLTAEEADNDVKAILATLEAKCGAVLR